MKKDKYIVGIWKFHERVGQKDLLEIAHEWAEDEKYKQLFVRKVSKDQDGICFIYEYDGSRENYDQYFNETTDMLKRRFGNDLVGWDISREVQFVKGIE